MNHLWQDIKYSVRQLLGNPGLSLVMILTLALGIGANTAIFSLINGVLLRPLPYKDADQLMQLRVAAELPGPQGGTFSIPELQDYRRQAKTVAVLSEYHSMTFNLIGQGEPERVRTGVVSAEFFDTLGIRPMIGRTFAAGDDRAEAPATLLLTHNFWRRRLASDPAVVGKVFQMNGLSMTAIGVLPPLPQFPGRDDVFITTPSCPFRSNPDMIHSRTARLVSLYGRLQPGVTLEEARADVSTVFGRLRQEYPDTYIGPRVSGVTLVPVRELLVSGFRPTLLLLLAAVGLVLLIACANLANLTLARLVRREREVVLRTALGAGRGRLIRQLLTESTLLALIGGLLGLLLAQAASSLLVSFAQRFTPRVQDIGVDFRVLLFTLGVSLITGISFGLIPALQAGRVNLAGILKEGGHSTAGRGRQLFRAALVVAQVAVAFILLTGAGLMLRSQLLLQNTETGFDPEDVLTMRIPLPFTKYEDPQKAVDFFELLLPRVRELPGVRSVALSSSFPLDLQLPMSPVLRVEGHAVAPGETEPLASFRNVTPDYFKTLGIPLLQGRSFDDRDVDGSEFVTVVSQSLARRHWPGQSPIGKRITSPMFGQDVWLRVVGVVGDVKDAGVDAEPEDTFYTAYLQTGGREMSLLVRSDRDLGALAGEVRRLVREMDSEQPVADVQTLAELRRDSLAPSRLTAVLLLLFAVVAFGITVAGLSGVVAFAVSQRTPEMGIRMALGASRQTVLGLILRQGMVLVLVGIVLGLAGAMGFTRVIASLLYGIQPSDPVTLAGSLVLVALVSFVACLLPAWRITGIDPRNAFRG